MEKIKATIIHIEKNTYDEGAVFYSVRCRQTSGNDLFIWRMITLTSVLTNPEIVPFLACIGVGDEMAFTIDKRNEIQSIEYCGRTLSPPVKQPYSATPITLQQPQDVPEENHIVSQHVSQQITTTLAPAGSDPWPSDKKALAFKGSCQEVISELFEAFEGTDVESKRQEALDSCLELLLSVRELSGRSLNEVMENMESIFTRVANESPHEINVKRRLEAILGLAQTWS